MSGPYRGVITDEDMAEMNLRTQRRRADAIARLGHRWLGRSIPGRPRTIDQQLTDAYAEGRADERAEWAPANVSPIKQRNAK